MDCTLFIPHLIPATRRGEAPWQAPEARRLKTLLARAAHTTQSALDTDAWLCNAFGIARQRDWPLAPIAAIADGIPAQTGYWLRATPAHLEPQRNALVLTDFAEGDISATEYETIAQMLAAHLREENITLHAPRPRRWYLHMPDAPEMRTFAADNALGRDVREFLPQGGDSLRWHRIITEMQMLLHAHPLNEAREARGQAAINSVWISGGGTLPPTAQARFTAVWSNDDIVRALARHSGRCAARLMNTIGQLSGRGHLLVTIESLAPAVIRDDTAAWCDAVHALEHEWIIPLVDAQKSRRIGTINLVCANREGVQQFILRPADILKLWRKNKYL